MRTVSSKQRWTVSLFCLLFMAAFSGCGQPEGEPGSGLREFLDTIKVVNTHEHQRWPGEEWGESFNFYTLLGFSYLKSDLVSAGAPALRPEMARQPDFEKLWSAFGPYLDYSRATTYYSHFLRGFQVLYGMEEDYFTAQNIKKLSEGITGNYADRDSWYSRAFEEAGFEVMFVDQYWAPFNRELDERFFALVFNINKLVAGATQRTVKYREEPSPMINVYRLAATEGFSIQSLDDYLRFADSLLEDFQESGAVCLKNSMAYARSLDYAPVPRERAEDLFSRTSPSLTPEERKELEDFMFHWIVQRSIDLDLPIQIHTGYLAGTGNRLENGRPTKLNNLFLRYRDAKFVLFHGGYPWTGEFAALGKMFPNVYLDLVWLPQLSREAAVSSLDEMRDGVPYNKFFWGGDCHQIEESTGSLEFARDVVAEVLAKRIQRGLMTEEIARDAARHIFRDNAVRFFKLEERLGREF